MDEKYTDHDGAAERSGGFGAPEVVLSESKKVRCDGGGGALGHPVVFYDMGEDDFVECLYCDRRFVLSGAGDHGH